MPPRPDGNDPRLPFDGPLDAPAPDGSGMELSGSDAPGPGTLPGTLAEHRSASSEIDPEHLHDGYQLGTPYEPEGYANPGAPAGPANSSALAAESTALAEIPNSSPPPPPAPPLRHSGASSSPEDSSGEIAESEEAGKMTFLDHLEELRNRIIRSVVAVVVAFLLCWTYADNLYSALAQPLTQVLREMHLDDHLVYTSPTGPFALYVQMSFVAALFVAAPFVLMQVWGFIAPGLYPHERRYAMPFIFLCSALFLAGGAFAYFVAFPATLRFLIGFASQFRPMITVNEYFSLALTIILGLAVVFELPMLILFLTLLRIVTPGFLIRNVRYAVLLIFFVAAIITPTPDVPTMMLFAAPLTALYFLGAGMSYLVVLMRRKKEREADAS